MLIGYWWYSVAYLVLHPSLTMLPHSLHPLMRPHSTHFTFPLQLHRLHTLTPSRSPRSLPSSLVTSRCCPPVPPSLPPTFSLSPFTRRSPLSFSQKFSCRTPPSLLFSSYSPTTPIPTPPIPSTATPASSNTPPPPPTLPFSLPTAPPSSPTPPLLSTLPSRRRRALRILLAIIALTFTPAFLFNLQNEEQRSWQLGLMKSLPLNVLSRVWGYLHSLTLPTPLRSPLYHLWTWMFDCNLDEASQPLNEYENLSQFFIRHLRPGVRPLAPADVVSPVDARVTVIGEVGRDGRLEQIKGMSYSLGEFLGFIPPPLTSVPQDPNAPHPTLHYIVFYLAPGDYHRIHNPTTALYAHRRHFPGHLFPVNPSIASFVPSLFCRNERVVLSGWWKPQGEESMVDGGRFFSMSMVGAYNVGSVRLSYDEALVTNRRGSWRDRRRQGKAQAQVHGMDVRGEKEVGLMDSVDGGEGYVKVYGKGKVEGGEVKPVHHGAAQEVEVREDVNGLRVNKGEEVARFELGSTVVLVFQTQVGEQWEWMVKEGDKVKMGQAVGNIHRNM